MKDSRGIRNNNLGNIRKSKDKWQGLSEVQTDPEFFQFKAPEWGYRALFKILKNYHDKYGLRTISDMIGRYAPPFENNTESYVHLVSSYSGIPTDDPIDINNREMMVRIIAGMSKVENGREADMSDVIAGWNLL